MRSGDKKEQSKKEQTWKRSFLPFLSTFSILEL